MPLKKRYISKGKVCKVTFVLPDDVEANESVHVVGDFNGWSETADPMSQLKSGEWKAHIKIDSDQEVEYRYLVDGEQWVNDDEADSYTPNQFGGENSVLLT